MSRIEQLIEELCPSGVEFKELGEVAEYRRGSFPQPYGETKWYDGENSMPFVQVGDVANNMRLVTDTKQKISKHAQPKSVFVPAETVVVTLQGSIGRVAITQYDSYVDRTLAIFEKYKIEIIKKYFAYQLERKFGIEKEFARGSTIKTITKEELTKFPIPLPPLPIQQEIVTILDTFTALDASLQAELEARRKQYEHYRNQLLNFEGKEVEWKTLGEVGKFIRGKRFVKNDIVTEGVPCIHYGEMYTYYKTWTKKTKSFLEPEKAEKLRLAKPGDVIIVTAGETIEDIGNAVAWLGETNVVIHDACFAYSHSFNPKFVSYFFQTDIFRSQIRKHISSSKISAILESGLSHAKIPVPPLSEQERIVGILDKFDALCSGSEAGMTGSGSGMTGSLPAEIDARRKQYEYYREKLLTFEPK